MAAVGVREILDPLRQAEHAPRQLGQAVRACVRFPVDGQLHVGVAGAKANRQAGGPALPAQTLVQAVSVGSFCHGQRIAAMKAQYIGHPKIVRQPDGTRDF